MILLAILYGCNTWSLKLREAHMLGFFSFKVLRKTLDPKERKQNDSLKNCIMMSFVICDVLSLLFG